ncbi:MAG: alkaline phosphatase D family protein [Solirubrobacterales bacterium]|nr:alkaline phosphatase D family protein [Solirubrobacterales bacterium]
MDADHLLTRRTVLATATAGVAAGAFPQTSVARRLRREPFARAGTFASGVASGQPNQRGITLWTRLHDIGASERLGMEIARDPGFARVVHRETIRAAAVRDFTARTRVLTRRLDPGERYFYRFFTRTTQSPVGAFKTLRPPDSREPVRIGWFSCQRYEHGFFTPHAGLAAEEDLDLVVSLGDYLYEEDSPAKLAEREQSTGDPNGHVETLEQWRAKHRLYRSDASLQAMHAAHPVIAIWDDCEVEGNWAGEGPSSGPSPVGPRSVPFSVKQRNGFLTFFENMPQEPIGSERFRIYRRLRLGGLVDLFLLDTRKYRDPQPCEDATFEGDVPPCLDADRPGRKRVGPAQQRWLTAGLERAQATWKVLGNAQMMMALDIAPTRPVGYDSWDGYGAERRAILEQVRASGVENLVSIVGDVHTFFAGELHTTGRIGSPVVGTEFVGTSVSHDGIEVVGDEQQSALVTDRIVLSNPHLRYAKFGVRGYSVLEARPDELRVDFKGVRSVLAPTSETYLLKSFRVAAGTPRVRPA